MSSIYIITILYLYLPKFLCIFLITNFTFAVHYQLIYYHIRFFNMLVNVYNQPFGTWVPNENWFVRNFFGGMCMILIRAKIICKTCPGIANWGCDPYEKIGQFYIWPYIKWTIFFILVSALVRDDGACFTYHFGSYNTRTHTPALIYIKKNLIGKFHIILV